MEGYDKGQITMPEKPNAPIVLNPGQGAIFVKNSTPSTIAMVGDDNAEHTVLTSGSPVLMSGMCNASGSYIGQYQVSGNYIDSSQVFLSGVAGMSGDWVGLYCVSGYAQASGVLMTSGSTVAVVSGMNLTNIAPTPRAASVQMFGDGNAVDTQSGVVLPLWHTANNWSSGTVSPTAASPTLNVTSATVMAGVDGFYQAHFDGHVTIGHVSPLMLTIGIGVVSASGLNAVIVTTPYTVDNTYVPFACHVQLPLLSGQAVVPVGFSPDGTYPWVMASPHLSLHELK